MNSTVYNNNFDLIRLLLASFVIITHSYALLGLPEQDWLWHSSSGNVAFSSLGVNGFFIVSGYLVCQSLERSSSAKSYIFKRGLRIFPGLFFALIFSWLLAFAHYNKPWFKFFLQPDAWSFIPRNIILWPQYTITGCFTKLPLAHRGGINGSLWTLGYEWLMYLILLPFFLIKLPNYRKMITVLVVGILFFTIYKDYHKNLPQLGFISIPTLVSLGNFFLTGSCLHLLGIGKRISWYWIFTAFGLLYLSIKLHQYFIGQYFFLPIIIIGIAQKKAWKITRFLQTRGDFSYGIYLMAFPIQQTIVNRMPEVSPPILTIVTWLLVLPVAYLSWHLIEKPAIQLKPRLKSN